MRTLNITHEKNENMGRMKKKMHRKEMWKKRKKLRRKEKGRKLPLCLTN
jgi:hypothetical protein